MLPGVRPIGVAGARTAGHRAAAAGPGVGGEYDGEPPISARWPPGGRGYYSSFQYVTLISGQLLALVLLLVLQQVHTPAQGGRGAGGSRSPSARRGPSRPLAAARQGRVGEPRRAAAVSPPATASRMLLPYPRQILTVVGLTLGGTLAFYTYTTYLQKFLVNSSGLAKGEGDLDQLLHAGSCSCSSSRSSGACPTGWGDVPC